MTKFFAGLVVGLFLTAMSAIAIPNSNFTGAGGASGFGGEGPSGSATFSVTSGGIPTVDTCWRHGNLSGAPVGCSTGGSNQQFRIPYHGHIVLKTIACLFGGVVGGNADDDVTIGIYWHDTVSADVHTSTGINFSTATNTVLIDTAQLNFASPFPDGTFSVSFFAVTDTDTSITIANFVCTVTW